MSGTERDPSLDAAWRAASREEPPAAIDEAIRAAARREVGAAPQRKRDKHWWYPYAAAATVAVIAFGLVQLTPPEEVAPVATTEMQKPSPFAKGEITSAPARSSDQAAPPAAPPPQTEAQAMDKLARGEPAASPAPRSEPFPAAPQAAERPAAPTPESAPAPMARRDMAAPEQPPVQPRTMSAQRPTLQAQSAPAEVAGDAAKPGQTRSADDWIRLIRDLRREGKVAEATKELAAFREAYGARAESLLPAELRDLAPPDAK